jgi:hypothetical protein
MQPIAHEFTGSIECRRLVLTTQLITLRWLSVSVPAVALKVPPRPVLSTVLQRLCTRGVQNCGKNEDPHDGREGE